MTKDEIKKGLECCCNRDFKTACRNCSYLTCPGCNDTLCKDALNLITEQEKEIEYRKKQYDNQVSENTRLYIEYDKLKDDYAKLQEQFAQYQMASDKEITAQVKQAQIEVLNRLKSLSIYDDNYLDGYVFIDDIDKLLEELNK